jgi:hypothetical protein
MGEHYSFNIFSTDGKLIGIFYFPEFKKTSFPLRWDLINPKIYNFFGFVGDNLIGRHDDFSNIELQYFTIDKWLIEPIKNI